MPKLIRDEVPEREGDIIKIANNTLYRALLEAKLYEECGELIASGCKDLYEYADILEVLRAIAAVNGIKWDDVLESRRKKLQVYGGFKGGRVLINPRSR